VLGSVVVATRVSHWGAVLYRLEGLPKLF